MADYVKFDFGQSIKSESGYWYRNVQLLGMGRNAATFLVLATSGPYQGTLFAMKLFKRLSLPDRRERFLKEVQFLNTCQHPAIMRTFDEGIYREQHPFVLAEYLPRTLEDVIRAGVSNLERISFSLQLLSALAYLDALHQGVVHRDIKPQNIFVKSNSCVLGDFGLMKHLPSDVEAADDRQTFLESPGPVMPSGYRTPDLVSYAKGEAALTTKSDVFQLGLVLAELFTGKNPQRRAVDRLDPIELDDLGRIPGALGPGIKNLISRMLVFDPKDRVSASRLLEPWQGIFLDAVKRAHALEGRVF